MTAHVSKTLRLCYSPKGRRSILALEQRLRRKASRLGVFARKSRAGGWLILTWRGGGVLAGPLLDWEAEEYLDAQGAGR
jgi:hypothetical protein